MFRIFKKVWMPSLCRLAWLARPCIAATVGDSETEFRIAWQPIFSPEPGCPGSGLNETKAGVYTRCSEF